ncbi:endonuclease domain-containing protein [Micromonospora sp. NPDC049282]|uniref:endonuclease domain-containing protein n=1 Tax=Micromonospora sp. NPDC049282 TaxID=3364269 RepID=UPI00371D7C17
MRAVGVIDGLLRIGVVNRSGLATEAVRNAGRPGGRRASWVFGLTDGCAQSPPESHLRVRLMLAGLPRPVARHPVRVSTGLVLHPDLAWPEFRVAVEYDGQWHADPDRMHLDRRRLNQLVEAGWLVLHVTGRRLRQEFPALVREIRAALVARGWRP